jgi:hypothetical protein
VQDFNGCPALPHVLQWHVVQGGVSWEISGCIVQKKGSKKHLYGHKHRENASVPRRKPSSELCADDGSLA